MSALATTVKVRVPLIAFTVYVPFLLFSGGGAVRGGLQTTSELCVAAAHP